METGCPALRSKIRRTERRTEICSGAMDSRFSDGRQACKFHSTAEARKQGSQFPGQSLLEICLKGIKPQEKGHSDTIETEETEKEGAKKHENIILRPEIL